MFGGWLRKLLHGHELGAWDFLKARMATPHMMCGGYFTSINIYEVWRARVRGQVSNKEFHTHIHLD